MKVLNLDSFAVGIEQRKLVIGGKEYVVEPMTVENFIVTTKAAESMAERPMSVSEQIEATIEMIIRSVPTIDRAVLQRMPLEHLRAVVAFVRGEDVEGAEAPKAVQPGEAGEGGEGK